MRIGTHRRNGTGVLAVGLLALAVGAQPAAASSEARLRAAETRALGAEHAAAHAASRRAAGAEEGGRSSGRALARAAALPSEEGRWRAPVPIPSVAIHSVLLRNGKVLYYDTEGRSANSGDARVFDPATRTTQQVRPPVVNGKPINLYCGSQTVLPDGRVLLMGGTLAYGPFRGLKTVFTFDPVSMSWARHGDMRHGRWYPTQVQLPDGRVVVIDGTDENAGRNSDIEVFDYRTNKTTFVASRGGTGNAPTGGLYPHMFTMKSGRSLVAGPNSTDSWFFTLTGSTFSWADAANPRNLRRTGAAVLLPGDSSGATKVMAIGGGGSAGVLRSTEVFDESSNSWTTGPSMNVARGHANVVLLPDRSMVAVGGGSYAGSSTPYNAGPEHRNVELFDPTTSSWRLGPAQAERRAYHSTAILLADGTVMSAGDDGGESSSDTVEIYEPPYLNKGGSRPSITNAPSSVGYGGSLPVSTSGGGTTAVLVAPGATTHTVDMQQRVVPLRSTARGDGSGLDGVAPSSAKVAPAGYYMLFALDARGVPSVAKWVKLG